MLTSDRLREPEFWLGVNGTSQKNDMLLKSHSLGASFFWFFFLIVLWDFSHLGGKVHMLSA